MKKTVKKKVTRLKSVTESHVAVYSALAERKHLYRERCLVVVAVVEEAATIHIHTIPTHTHTHTITTGSSERTESVG